MCAPAQIISEEGDDSIDNEIEGSEGKTNIGGNFNGQLSSVTWFLTPRSCCFQPKYLSRSWSLVWLFLIISGTFSFFLQSGFDTVAFVFRQLLILLFFPNQNDLAGYGAWFCSSTEVICFCFLQV